MTSSPVSAKHCATAILAGVPSRQHQTKLRLTCAAWLAAASDNQPQDWSASCRAGLVQIVLDFAEWFLPLFDANSLLNWRGLRSASFSRPHSHRLVVLPASRNLRASVFAGAPLISNSHDHRGANRTVVHSLPAKQTSKRIAYRLHFPNALSSSLVSVGIDPNENGLTHAQIPFAPGANSDD